MEQRPEIEDYLQGRNPEYQVQYTSDWRRYSKAQDEHIDELEKQVKEGREWVDVKDRLPKKGESVIIYSNGYVEWKCAHIDKYGWTYVGSNYIDTVTHWMALPEAPIVGD